MTTYMEKTWVSLEAKLIYNILDTIADVRRKIWACSSTGNIGGVRIIIEDWEYRLAKFDISIYIFASRKQSTALGKIIVAAVAIQAVARSAFVSYENVVFVPMWASDGYSTAPEAQQPALSANAGGVDILPDTAAIKEHCQIFLIDVLSSMRSGSDTVKPVYILA